MILKIFTIKEKSCSSTFTLTFFLPEKKSETLRLTMTRVMSTFTRPYVYVDLDVEACDFDMLRSRTKERLGQARNRLQNIIPADIGQIVLDYLGKVEKITVFS